MISPQMVKSLQVCASCVKQTTRQHVNLNDQQEERDMTFIADYSIRYLGCQSVVQLASGENHNPKNNQQQSVLYAEHRTGGPICFASKLR